MNSALTLLYEMVDLMTVANGYRFDWLSNKGNDKFFKAEDNPKLHILLADEENVDDVGAIGSDEYIDDQFVIMTAKVAIGGDIDPQELTYEQQNILERAKRDIKNSFSSGAYLCDQIKLRPSEFDVYDTQLKYVRSRYQLEEVESKFSIMRIICTFRLKYRSKRFIDG